MVVFATNLVGFTNAREGTRKIRRVGGSLARKKERMVGRRCGKVSGSFNFSIVSRGRKSRIMEARAGREHIRLSFGRCPEPTDASSGTPASTLTPANRARSPSG